jgi:hypothetical protein
MFRSNKTYLAIVSYYWNSYVCYYVWFILCYIICFQSVDHRVESERLENFQDVDFEDLEQ